jgi:iron complex outermembrane receptor protein
VAGQKLVKRKLVFNNISVNAGMNFNLGDAKVLGLNFYLTQRDPDISEMFSDGLHHALATIEYGDPSLTQETTKK